MMSKHRTVATHEPPAKGHTISLKAPAAKSVAVTGSFCNWVPQGHPLKHDHQGVWKATLNLPPGRYEYRMLVDGQWYDDPSCPERVPNPFGTENCVFRI